MGVEMYADSEIDPVLRGVCKNWIDKIQNAKNHKAEVFGKYATECQTFYDGPKNWSEAMGGGSSIETDDGFPELSFKLSINKAAEFQGLFGPALYEENPVRTAKPLAPVVIPPQFFPDPALYQAVVQQENVRIQTDGLRGVLLESMMNWSPNDFDLAGESRKQINEALIKGRGLLWTELFKSPKGSFRTVRTSFDTVENLFVDPDAPSLKDATWIARRFIRPTWRVERDFGLRAGCLRGTHESQARQADVASSEDLQYDQKRGLTNDLIVYYKVYSKMGIGGRLQGASRSDADALEIFGDYCYLVVAEGVPFALNLPPEVCNDPKQTRESIFARVAWPTPFWEAGEWPCTELDFNVVPNCAWPTPPLKFAMGELKFLNWVFSFLMGKLRTTLRDIIALDAGVDEETKETILHGKDLELIKLKGQHKSVADLFQVLKFDPVNGDVWKMIAAVEELFDKRMGLTDLMYGNQGATQIRSAQEASIRTSNMNVRPDDMRKQVEACHSRVAAKEAACLRWHIKGQDVSPVIGPIGAMAWDNYVVTTDLAQAFHQLEYRVESGSTRRPNKGTQIDNMNKAMQTLMPVLQGYSQQTGDLAPVNNLLGDFAQSLDLNPARYQMQMALPPPQPAGPAAPAGSADDPNSQPAQAG